MRFQYASDFHLEVHHANPVVTTQSLVPSAPILLLAGDMMAVGAPEQWENLPFWDWCSRNFEHTYLLPGNHEHYAGLDPQASSRGWERQLRPNVTMLASRSVVAGDTELFFTTLWSRIAPENHAVVQRDLPDCRLITCGGHPMQPGDYAPLHQRCRQWLHSALAASTAAHKVVVTHHCPVPLEDPRYESNGLSDAFIAPMTGFIAEHPDVEYWLFGHTHYNGGNRMRQGATTLLTNQLGYTRHGICAGYDPGAVFQTE